LVALLADGGRRALHGNSASGAAGVIGTFSRALGFTDSITDLTFDGPLRGTRVLCDSKLIQDVIVDGV
jgi:hypothetical protein